MPSRICSTGAAPRRGGDALTDASPLCVPLPVSVRRRCCTLCTATCLAPDSADEWRGVTQGAFHRMTLTPPVLDAADHLLHPIAQDAQTHGRLRRTVAGRAPAVHDHHVMQ